MQAKTAEILHMIFKTLYAELQDPASHLSIFKQKGSNTMLVVDINNDMLVAVHFLLQARAHFCQC